MHRTGLAPSGHDDDAVRWVAVRHGPDHVHVVAMLARQDGGRPRLPNERYRVREACRAAEERHGLRRIAPGDRTAARRPSRAEAEKARRGGRSEPPRVTLRRAVAAAAAGASDETEFLAWLARACVLARVRHSTRAPGEITGYAVACGDTLVVATLMTRLAVLAEAVTELRRAQQHAAQAAAGRQAAGHLHAAVRHLSLLPQAPATGRPRTAAGARPEFPAPLGPALRQPAGPRPEQPPRPRVPVSRQPRGPTR
jgi:hypothetical protein